jgi:alkylation response protein AidB-like acyl-CoA dehydrogenase
LAASPLISTAVLGASAVLLAGNEEQKAAVLPSVITGDRLLALALEEGPRHAPTTIATRASEQDGSYVLTGTKKHVLDGHVADQFIVVARSSGELTDEQGISLFLVDSNANGIAVSRRSMIDSRNMADVEFDGVTVPAENLLGELGGGYSVVNQVVDRGNIALAAEMLGSQQAAFERILDFLKQREQFGEVIGTFQALQHRASHMFCEIEMSKSVVLQALRSVDEQADNVSLMASLAKAQVSETFRLVSDEAIQMFGGIGMTDEEEVGFFLKRARVAVQTLGDENYHVQRYASLRGY